MAQHKKNKRKIENYFTLETNGACIIRIGCGGTDSVQPY